MQVHSCICIQKSALGSKILLVTKYILEKALLLWAKQKDPLLQDCAVRSLFSNVHYVHCLNNSLISDKQDI